MTLAEEKITVEQARQDARHFAPVYDHFYGKIFGYVLRRTGDYELARDVTADTFLKAVLKLPDFEWRETSGIAPWLFRIATNELRQFYRRRKYESQVFGALPEQFVLEQNLHRVFEAEKAMVEAQLAQHEDFVSAQKAMQHIGLKYQEVLSLRYFEQKTVREIAEITGKNEGTVKSLLSRGTQKIAQMLSK